VAATSIRWAVAKEIVEQLETAAAAETALSIEPGWPGELAMRSEMIWFDEISSTVDVPTMTGGRLHRDDLFTIATLVRVSGQTSLDATMTRLEALCAYVEDLAADDHTLSGMDGVLSVEVTAADVTCGTSPDGFLGFARMEIRVHSRLI